MMEDFGKVLTSKHRRKIIEELYEVVCFCQFSYELWQVIFYQRLKEIAYFNLKEHLEKAQDMNFTCDVCFLVMDREDLEVVFMDEEMKKWIYPHFPFR